MKKVKKKETKVRSIHRGWGDATDIPEEVLKLIGWKEYIETSSKPYPSECFKCISKKSS